MAIINCPECGKEISDTSKVCIHCGYNLKGEEQKKRKQNMKKAIKPILIIVLIVAVVFGIYKLFLPDLFTSVDEYIARGDYEAAYKKERNEEKRQQILLENHVAWCCERVAKSLKDPTSFKLSEGLVSMGNHILLEVIGKNSYGNNVTNYWVYDAKTLSDFAKVTYYEYNDSFADLDEEQTYSWDDANEQYEKAVRNLLKSRIQLNLSLGIYEWLSDESVANINSLFSAGKLKDISIIWVPEDEETLKKKTEDAIEEKAEEAAVDAVEEKAGEAVVDAVEEKVEEVAVDAAEEEAEEAASSAVEEAAEEASKSGRIDGLKDGNYSIEKTTDFSIIGVAIVIRNHEIIKAGVSSKALEGQVDMLNDDIRSTWGDQIINKHTVDAVSGVTYSSDAVKEAVEELINKARNDN